MKFIIGPGHRQLKILNKAGEDITAELGVIELNISMGLNDLPSATIHLEIIGAKHEIEIKEKKILAVLHKSEIVDFHTAGEEEITLANIHPDA